MISSPLGQDTVRQIAMVDHAPLATGSLAETFGRIDIAFDMGTAMLAASALILIAFRQKTAILVPA